jgi:hypothetical protein
MREEKREELVKVAVERANLDFEMSLQNGSTKKEAKEELSYSTETWTMCEAIDLTYTETTEEEREEIESIYNEAYEAELEKLAR